MGTTPEPPQPVRHHQVGRPYLTFLLGITLADLADRGWLLVLAFTAASLGSPLTAALVIAAGTLPRAVLVLVGGAFADRLPTRPLLIGADLLRVAVLVGALVALTRGDVPVLPLVFAIGVLFGVADAVHLPAVGTMPRQLVPTEALVSAAGLRQMGARLAYLAGPPLAGAALAHLLLQQTLALLTIPFLLAALVLVFVRPRFRREPAPRQSIPAAVAEVTGYLRGNAGPRDLVLSMLGVNVLVIPVVSVGVALRVHAEGWGAASLGLLTGLIGAGAVVGTLISLRLSQRRPLRLAYAAFTTQSVAMVAIALAPEWGVGAAMAGIGLISGLACPPLAGMLQARVEAGYLGRIYSLLALSDDGLLPLAIAGFGAVSAAAGLTTATLICAGGTLIWMGSALLRPSLRDLTVEEATALAEAPLPAAGAYAPRHAEHAHAA